MYACQFCDPPATFATESARDDHLGDAHRFCPIGGCLGASVAYPSYDRLLSHLKHGHHAVLVGPSPGRWTRPAKTPVVCPSCAREFASPAFGLRHARAKHPGAGLRADEFARPVPLIVRLDPVGSPLPEDLVRLLADEEARYPRRSAPAADPAPVDDPVESVDDDRPDDGVWTAEVVDAIATPDTPPDDEDTSPEHADLIARLDTAWAAVDYPPSDPWAAVDPPPVATRRRLVPTSTGFVLNDTGHATLIVTIDDGGFFGLHDDVRRAVLNLYETLRAIRP